jgi:hypothetical protein
MKRKPNIVRVIKSKGARWAGHVALMVEGRGEVCLQRFAWEARREETIGKNLERLGSMGRTGFGWLWIGFSGGLL